MSEITRTPELIAAEIGVIREHTRQVVLSSALEIGKRLIEAKALLPHGKWGGFLEGLDYSERTAQNLMRVFEEYGKNPNPQALADLSYTKAVAMLALDGEQRERLMQESDVAAMSTRELQAEIDAMRARDEERQVKLEELESRLREEEQTNSVMAVELSIAKEGRKADAQRMEAQLREAARGTQELGEKLKDAEERAHQAEKRLAEIPEPAELPEPEKVVEVVEVIPEATKEELERLRRIAAKAPDEATIRFRAEYQRLVEQFNLVVGLLSGLPDAEKYRAAVRKAAETMAGRLSE